MRFVSKRRQLRSKYRNRKSGGSMRRINKVQYGGYDWSKQTKISPATLEAIKSKCVDLNLTNSRGQPLCDALYAYININRERFWQKLNTQFRSATNNKSCVEGGTAETCTASVYFSSKPLGEALLAILTKEGVDNVRESVSKEVLLQIENKTHEYATKTDLDEIKKTTAMVLYNGTGNSGAALERSPPKVSRTAALERSPPKAKHISLATLQLPDSFREPAPRPFDATLQAFGQSRGDTPSMRQIDNPSTVKPAGLGATLQPFGQSRGAAPSVLQITNPPTASTVKPSGLGATLQPFGQSRGAAPSVLQITNQPTASTVKPSGLGATLRPFGSGLGATLQPFGSSAVAASSAVSVAASVAAQKAAQKAAEDKLAQTKVAEARAALARAEAEAAAARVKAEAAAEAARNDKLKTERLEAERLAREEAAKRKEPDAAPLVFDCKNFSVIGARKILSEDCDGCIKPMKTKSDAKTNYRRLTMKHHPDKNPDDEDAARERFESVHEAWQGIQQCKHEENFD